MTRHLLRFSTQIRQASGVVWGSPRYARAIRAESNIDTAQDPPTAPLPENHEAGDGISDFSNWLDKHEDVSTVQAVTGLAGMLSFCYATYRYSIYRAENSDPTFTRREFPTVKNYLPTWDEAKDVRTE